MILDNYILKMISMQEVPARNYNKETKTWIPTGGVEKLFELIFVSDDEFKTKVVLNSRQDYSKFEGKKVNIVLDWKYNDFQKKMGMPTLADIVAAE